MMTELGSKDEKQEPEKGTVEYWARSPKNPIGGWYGLKKGFKGRFAMYIPPLMEELGLAGVEHNPRNNRMRAKYIKLPPKNGGSFAYKFHAILFFDINIIN